MGTPGQITEIRGMVSELDAPVEMIQKVTESFALSSVDEVDAVMTMVKQIYESRHEGLVNDPPDAAFLPDLGNRLLIVVAKPDHIEEIKTACLWKKKSSTFEPDFFPVRLESDPWIVQPTEHYEELSIEDILAKQKKG